MLFGSRRQPPVCRITDHDTQPVKAQSSLMLPASTVASDQTFMEAGIPAVGDRTARSAR
jgi:hypothetical protein